VRHSAAFLPLAAGLRRAKIFENTRKVFKFSGIPYPLRLCFLSSAACHLDQRERKKKPPDSAGTRFALIFLDSLILFAYPLHPEQHEGLTPLRIPQIFATVKEREKPRRDTLPKTSGDSVQNETRALFFWKTLPNFRRSFGRHTQNRRARIQGKPPNLRGARLVAAGFAPPLNRLSSCSYPLGLKFYPEYSR